MKIGSYAVASSSESVFAKAEFAKTKVSLTPVSPQGQKSVNLSLSDTVKNLVNKSNEDRERMLQSLKSPLTKVSSARADPKTSDELRSRMIEELYYLLTGKRMRAQKVSDENQPRPLRQLMQSGTMTTEQISYEYESVSYSAKGIVQTADGKSIEFDVSMNMSRETYSYLSATTSFENRAVDPLVINYGGSATSLTDEKFEFDLDFDGKIDSISFAAPGSGFLALDKNGDGKINDGRELFGPATGSGFGELREYDADGNGWIDENDAVYGELRIWSKDKNGDDQLYTLKELDIGAIYLGDIATKFSVTGSDNTALGSMSSTSFFLKDGGGAGTISHVDLIT